ncbi:hypothetical protein AB1L30_13950 [Bremerella sp. JC817]|uniref:hypothetical protein n=1 Tax=Bremerella sp. JC817 TaxID=3231756 RepID=UPI00345A5F89
MAPQLTPARTKEPREAIPPEAYSHNAPTWLRHTAATFWLGFVLFLLPLALGLFEDPHALIPWGGLLIVLLAIGLAVCAADLFRLGVRLMGLAALLCSTPTLLTKFENSHLLVGTVLLMVATFGLTYGVRTLLSLAGFTDHLPKQLSIQTLLLTTAGFAVLAASGTYVFQQVGHAFAFHRLPQLIPISLLVFGVSWQSASSSVMLFAKGSLKEALLISLTLSVTGSWLLMLGILLEDADFHLITMMRMAFDEHMLLSAFPFAMGATTFYWVFMLLTLGSFRTLARAM